MTPREVRIALRRNGYSPIPVYGKSPHLPGWNTKLQTTLAEIASWDLPRFGRLETNTGILTRFAPAIDVDITLLPAAEAVEEIAREEFEERGRILVRIGKAPKRIIPLRTDEPFTKIRAEFTAPNDSLHAIEVLGDGQQFVVNGVHPDTGKPYSWHSGAPWETPREELPYVRRDDIVTFLEKATKLLGNEFGFKPTGTISNRNDASTTPPAAWRDLVARSVTEGNRDGTITRLAGHLLRRNIDPFVVLELLRVWNAAKCTPPLPEANKPAPWSPTRRKIGDLFEALAAVCILDSDIDQPRWLDGRTTGVIVAVNNGLLDIEQRRLLRHTPLFFNQTAVPFD